MHPWWINVLIYFKTKVLLTQKYFWMVLYANNNKKNFIRDIEDISLVNQQNSF